MKSIGKASSPRRSKGLTLLPLVMSIYFVVSGGPYAMEKLVSSSGAGIAMLLILVTPVIWSVPAALMTAELTSAMPQEGGYYIWVREALGPFAGFLCGWWSWVYSWVDTSVYPGLFVAYMLGLCKQIPSLNVLGHVPPTFQWLLGVSVMIPLVLINVRGIRITGEANILFGLLMLAPFAIMVTLALVKFTGHPRNVFLPITPPGVGLGSSVGAGLFLIMWNYMAWDSLSTVTGEADRPIVTFPKALLWALPLVVGCYLLTFGAGLAVVPNIAKWVDGAWPDIAASVGGHWLGFAIGCGAVISVLGMFNATLLAASRVPLVLSEDNYLPGIFGRVHPRYKTPWVGILVSAAISTLLAIRSFDTLVKVDVLVYSSGLVLEFIALLVFRYKRPEMPRPYRIGGGMPVIWLLVLAPAVVIAAAFWVTLTDAPAAEITIACLASGPVVYSLVWLAKMRSRREKA